jgi:glucosyl-dolichyl phosphate glucuronosyltransferase
MAIDISAIVCTHNRASYLRKALASLCKQTLDDERYEILVVDNGSTDGTAAVVKQEFAGVGNLRYVFEPELGLSIARNEGARVAKAAFLAYLDDDAIADPRWLEEAVTTFSRPDARIGIVGGPIVPIWEAPRPAWLPDALLGYLTILDESAIREGTLEPAQQIYGANLLVARQALEAAGGFKVNLGRKGKNLLSNEELALRAAIEQAGFVTYFNPRIVVQHHVVPERLEKRWFYRRLYWQGRSDAADCIARTTTRSAVAQRAFHETVLLTKTLARVIRTASRPSLPTSKRFQEIAMMFKKIGMVRGFLSFGMK